MAGALRSICPEDALRTEANPCLVDCLSLRSQSVGLSLYLYLYLSRARAQFTRELRSLPAGALPRRVGFCKEAQKAFRDSF